MKKPNILFINANRKIAKYIDANTKISKNLLAPFNIREQYPHFSEQSQRKLKFH